MATYTSFTNQFPVFAAAPYNVVEVTDKLEEADMLFPLIDSCLPESVRLLATKYAVLYLYNQDNAGCYGGKSVVELKSLSDSVRFNVVSGKPYSLDNDTYGRRLVQMFKQYGCDFGVGAGVDRCCPRR